MNLLTPPKTALIVFAKRPKIGHGKQRLAADIGKDKAYKVAQSLLDITLNTVSKWTDTLVISSSEQSDSQWACDLLDCSIISIPQNTNSLGTRLEQIDREVRMLGYSHLIFIGTDAPLLTTDDLLQVKTNLEQYQQIFIPANDGGVVLMASSQPWSNLESVEWSTEKVFTQLKSLAIQQGLSVQIKQELIDLDDLTSLNELKPKLQQLNKPLLNKLLVLLDSNE